MHDNIEYVSTKTPDLALERQEQLRQLFPEAWSETGFDLAKLGALLGDLSDERPERYRFEWAGKREALQLLQTRSHATLLPQLDQSLDFEATRNWFIEGDNLEVLKLLYKPLFNRVKMIYIDPPYNTGNDFIYPDNFSDPLKNYLIQTGQKDPNGDLQTSTPDTAGRVHSSWLSMLYPRLTLARSLLRDDGVIFVSIDDNEVHHLRLLMNEVFGEENITTSIIVRANSRGQTYQQIAKTHEYVLVAKRSAEVELLELEKDSKNNDLNFNDELGAFNIREIRNRNPKFGKHNRPNLFYPIYVNPNLSDEDGFYPVSAVATDDFSVEVLPYNSTGMESCWRWGKPLLISKSNADTRRSNAVAKQKGDGTYSIFEKYRKTTFKPKSIWDDNGVLTETGTSQLKSLNLGEVFPFPKPVELVKRCAQLSTEDDDIILDFFAGSGTTAQAVLELNREDGGNRRFVLVQLPEKTGNTQFPTIADIGAERIRRVIARMKEADNGTLDVSTRETPEDLGFKVWKLAPSNFRQMQRVEDGDTAAYLHQLELLNDALLPGCDERAVLYEVALREGFDINCTLEPVADLEGVKVWRVTDDTRGQSFFVSLDETLQLETLRPLKLKMDDLFICRGVALDDDTAANLALQCRLKMI